MTDNLTHQSLSQQSTPEATPDTAIQPKTNFESFLFGKPLKTDDSAHETIGKGIGLAVFASDALSSMAYSTQEMMVVLIAAGTAGMNFVMPLTFLTVGLLIILTISYEQTIHAYPDGGGAYIVSRDNLGTIPAMIAAAALLTDYILTVAVSISSGVAQITSIFPDLYQYRVPIAVGFVLLVMLINLRGVKESGVVFAIPTYIFLGSMALMVLVGFFRYITGSLGTVVNPPHSEFAAIEQSLTVFLILKAFANGTTALTGVEAISNGITAFKEPRTKNAGETLMMMSTILGILLIGVSFLSFIVGAVPSELEGNISQVARTIYGSRNFIYLITVGSTMVILVMAANTAFAGYPRLSAILAGDGFLPRRFSWRGPRLVYTSGIVFLSLVAIALILIFQASVNRLIPLYAVGVFFSFTLSQLGMAKRWHRSGTLQKGEVVKTHGKDLTFDSKWVLKMSISGLGALISAIIALVFAVTKFTSGAWFILILTPILVLLFMHIKGHYDTVARKLSLSDGESQHIQIRRNHVILLLSGVHQSSLKAYHYAQTLSTDITVMHVAVDPDKTEKIRETWEKWSNGEPIVIIPSPYRLLTDPIVDTITSHIDAIGTNEVITIVVPHFISNTPAGNLLHEHTADTLRKALIKYPKIVVTEVPFNLDEIS